MRGIRTQGCRGWKMEGTDESTEITKGLFKKCTISCLFFYIFVFSIHLKVNKWSRKISPMTGFKLHTSGSWSDRYAHWVTSSAYFTKLFLVIILSLAKFSCRLCVEIGCLSCAPRFCFNNLPICWWLQKIFFLYLPQPPISARICTSKNDSILHFALVGIKIKFQSYFD